MRDIWTEPPEQLDQRLRELTLLHELRTIARLNADPYHWTWFLTLPGVLAARVREWEDWAWLN